MTSLLRTTLSIGRAAGSIALLSTVLLSTGAGALAQANEAEARKDPVLKAMLDELARSKDLELPPFPKPFFIQYKLDDVQGWESTATYGSTVSHSDEHHRVVRVTVRVGNYKTDSSMQQGDGSLMIATLDDDPVALRSALWSATDTAYKAAIRMYTQKQATLKTFQNPPTVDDFSHETAVVKLEPVRKLEIDRAAWEKRVQDASGLYRNDPKVKSFEQDIEYSWSKFSGHVLNSYLVNTEGTIVRTGSGAYQAAFVVGTQAADGMKLERSYGSQATSAAKLDSPEQFRDHAIELLLSLEELRKAPLVDEEYHGPVLFSNDASTDMFNDLFAPHIAATPPPIGTEARTKGPFTSSFHARVLPEFLNVTDEPSLKTFKGRELLGAYDVDSEGVPAQVVKVVENGKLENYLVSRQPIRDFPQSNGHGRAMSGGPARPMIGVLKIEATGGVSGDELNKKLLAMAKDRGLKQVYTVETLGPAVTPRLIYRVNVADGSKQLVRGAALDDLDQRNMRSGIAAAGNDLYVGNYFADVSTTVMAPALLFEDVTVKRANEKNEKLPYYPPPS